MKILCLANERSDAQVAARAVRAISSNVTVLWAPDAERAVFWIRETPDLAAFMLEAGGDGDVRLFLEHARRSGLRAPVVLILPEGSRPPVEFRQAGADDYVVKSDAYSRELPAAVIRAIDRVQAGRPPFEAPPAPPEQTRVEQSSAAADRQTKLEELANRERAMRTDLERRLEVAEAALRDAEQRHAMAMTQAAEQLAERQAQYEIGMERAAATWELVDKQLREAATDVERARQSEASVFAEIERLTKCEADLTAKAAETAAALTTLERRAAETEGALRDATERATQERSAAAEEASERQRAFEVRLNSEIEKRRSVEGRLASAESARDAAERLHDEAVRSAAANLAEHQARFDAALAETTAARDTLGRVARDLEEALGKARQIEASNSATIEQLTRREVEANSLLAEAVATRKTLERKLAGTESAFRDADERGTRDRLAAAKRAAERQAELEGVIRQERAERTSVEQRLAQAEAALRDAEERHAAAMTTTAAELAERQAQSGAELLAATSARDALTQRLNEAESALETARHAHTSAAGEVTRLTEQASLLSSQLAAATAAGTTLERQLTEAGAALKNVEESADRDRLAAATKAAGRETELEGVIRQERAERTSVEQRLAQAEAALRDAGERHAAAMTTTAAELAERQAQSGAELLAATSARDALTQRLNEAESALETARHAHTSAAGEVTRLTEQASLLSSQLAAATAAGTTLERQLTEAGVALKNVEESANRDRLAAAAKAGEREAELDELIRRERTARTNVEERLTSVEASIREAEQQHASAMTLAGAELAKLEAHFETELSQASAVRSDLTRRLRDAESALEEAQQDRTSSANAIQRLVEREAELTSQLADAAAARTTLEREVNTLTTGAKDAAERAGLEHAAATKRQADIEAQLAEEVEKGARALEHVARLDDQIARERVDHAGRLAKMSEDARQLEAERDSTHRLVVSVREQSQRLDADHRLEREKLERARRELDAKVQRLSAEHANTLHNLESLRASAQAAEHDQLQRRTALQTALDTRNREIAQLQDSLKATIHDLAGARRRCELLQTETDKVPQLQKQLEESHVELRRQFQHSPVPLCRYTRGGVLVHANRALAALLDYRKPDELRAADFVATVFESPSDLSWLIERHSSTGEKESVETTWKKLDGTKVAVRLSVVASSADLVEIAAEDLTSLRALQERLNQAQRMEAVGRLASETAVTCGNLLKDVHEDARRWLEAISGDDTLRQRGAMLLDELSRARRFLQQLAAYGDEQVNALAPVDLNKVLRDLKPVLKQVAGDDVELEFEKFSSPLNVDVKLERVERILVNLAGYGRERMPMGGRLKIELASVVVDGGFIARYPNVRQGPHALITVTEVRRRTVREGPLDLRGRPAKAASNEVPADKPGMDLGALQEIIGECGGHLWMTVEPPGNMVVKVRLPLRVWDDQTQTGSADTGSGLARAAGRLFGR